MEHGGGNFILIGHTCGGNDGLMMLADRCVDDVVLLFAITKSSASEI